MSRFLITGISGFAGSHLAEYLLKNNLGEVHGTIRTYNADLDNLKEFLGQVKLQECDLTDFLAVERVIKEVQPDFVCHLAAQAFVPKSWEAPRETINSNIIASVNLFEAIRKADLNPKIQIAGCYSEDTTALTATGFKSFKEIKKGDRVLSINPKTEEIEFKKVKKVILQKYKGKMIHFKSRSCDLLVTPNHNMLFKKTKTGKLLSQKANNIKKRKRIYLPLGKSKGKKLNYPEELFYLTGIFIGDGYLCPSKKTLNWSGLSHQEYVSKKGETGKVMGVKKSLKKTYSSQRVFLTIPKKDKCRKKVEDALKKLEIKYKGYDKTIYFVPDKKLNEVFQQCGKDAFYKTIPNWMLSASGGLLGQLYEGLIDSDGNHRKKREEFTTVSPYLVPKFIELCRKIGYWVTFSKVPPKISSLKDRKIFSREHYTFSITHNQKIVLKATELDYEGIIWCVEVEDNHNFLVSRNGKSMFCGNSSEEYGLVKPEETPITEKNELRPLSPYAVSKVAMDYFGYQYFKSYGLQIVATRTFNHTGPRRGKVYVVSDWCKQIAEIEAGLRKPVMFTGNLEAKRDFTDVRDIAKAYHLAVTKGRPGERYNIGSGKAYTMGEIQQTLFKLTSTEIENATDPGRMRPSDVPLLVADSTKFREETGWQPEIPFEQTLEDTLNYWRKKVNEQR